MITTKNKKDKWIKLICGASNEDIVAIEDLCAIYTAAGVDYIDVAAEESIVHAAVSYTHLTLPTICSV